MPVEVLEFSTREPDVAFARLSSLYSPERPLTLSGGAERFACDFRAATLGDLGADRLRFATGMRTQLAPLDYFLVAAGVRGACRYVAGREAVDRATRLRATG